jgi:hypothetical protein
LLLFCSYLYHRWFVFIFVLLLPALLHHSPPFTKGHPELGLGIAGLGVKKVTQIATAGIAPTKIPRG